jgi:hypothetical protein
MSAALAQNDLSCGMKTLKSTQEAIQDHKCSHWMLNGLDRIGVFSITVPTAYLPMAAGRKMHLFTDSKK